MQIARLNAHRTGDARPVIIINTHIILQKGTFDGHVHLIGKQVQFIVRDHHKQPPPRPLTMNKKNHKILILWWNLIEISTLKYYNPGFTLKKTRIMQNPGNYQSDYHLML